MSDERLRQLERRWRETGAVEDEATYLAERVRVGALRKEYLELAAFVGLDAARQVLGPSAPEVRPLSEWLAAGKAPSRSASGTQSLARWGKDACVIAGVATTRAALCAWKAKCADDDRPAKAVELTHDWYATGDDAARRRLVAAQVAARQAYESAHSQACAEAQARGDVQLLGLLWNRTGDLNVVDLAHVDAAWCATQLPGLALESDPADLKGRWASARGALRIAEKALRTALLAGGEDVNPDLLT